MLLHQRPAPTLCRFLYKNKNTSISMLSTGRPAEGKTRHPPSWNNTLRIPHGVKPHHPSSASHIHTWKPIHGIVFSKPIKHVDHHSTFALPQEGSSENAAENRASPATPPTKLTSPSHDTQEKKREYRHDPPPNSPFEGDISSSSIATHQPDTTASCDTVALDLRDAAVKPEDFSEQSWITYLRSEYHIPKSTLREAMLASRATGAAYWQYSLYEGPLGKKVKIHYCKSLETTERVAQLFLDKEILGFDIEWKPNATLNDGIKKNVALVQLASEERIALFHVARYAREGVDDLVSPTFKRIMESSEITKVGVSVKADCTRLSKFMGIRSRGLFELSHLYKLIKHSTGNVKMIDKRLVSLAQQVEEHLQLPMWKGQVRSSDWSQDLGYEQIKYAASDSYAGLQLYDVMEGKRNSLVPIPPRPAHADLNLPIRLANGQTVATYDESDEVVNEALTKADEGPSIEVEEMARDDLNISVEDGATNQKAPSSENSTTRPNKSPEILAAEDWAHRWRSSHLENGPIKASPAFLKAYYLWHHLGKEVPVAAAILKEPPLQPSTVSNYVLSAIRLENLPYKVDRLSDVLVHLPEPIAKARYQALRKQISSLPNMRCSESN